MLSTFLFDLDGTLVPMDMEEFIKAYFQAVACKFAHLFEPRRLISHIYDGTMAMVEDLDPQRTNQEVFWSCFSQGMGTSQELLEPLFDEFYNHDFTRLKAVSHPNPLARPALERLLKRGYRLAIATNPVFPERAIRERLDWVGIGDLPYDLVTTYENMHFCKPRIEYYQEVLDRLGARPEECLMVGNDVEEDLIARRLGIRTFLVEDWLINSKNLPIKTDYRGSFQELTEFLERVLVGEGTSSYSR